MLAELLECFCCTQDREGCAVLLSREGLDLLLKGDEQPAQACMPRCPAEAPRRAHLVQCGCEGEPLVEPDNCSHAILVREGQHAVGSPPPALAALPAYCNCFSARWPGLQSVHMDTELEPRCTQTGLPLRKHAGSTGLAGSSCSRCRKGWLQLMVTETLPMIVSREGQCQLCSIV